MKNHIVLPTGGNQIHSLNDLRKLNGLKQTFHSLLPRYIGMFKNTNTFHTPALPQLKQLYLFLVTYTELSATLYDKSTRKQQRAPSEKPISYPIAIRYTSGAPLTGCHDRSAISNHCI